MRNSVLCTGKDSDNSRIKRLHSAVVIIIELKAKEAVTEAVAADEAKQSMMGVAVETALYA